MESGYFPKFLSSLFSDDNIMIVVAFAGIAFRKAGLTGGYIYLSIYLVDIYISSLFRFI